MLAVNTPQLPVDVFISLDQAFELDQTPHVKQSVNVSSALIVAFRDIIITGPTVIYKDFIKGMIVCCLYHDCQIVHEIGYCSVRTRWKKGESHGHFFVQSVHQ